jgi:hypothetical protein
MGHVLTQKLKILPQYIKNRRWCRAGMQKMPRGGENSLYFTTLPQDATIFSRESENRQPAIHKSLDTCVRLCNMLHMVLLPGKDKQTVRITKYLKEEAVHE